MFDLSGIEDEEQRKAVQNAIDAGYKKIYETNDDGSRTMRITLKQTVVLPIHKKDVEAAGLNGENGANVKLKVTVLGQTVKDYNNNNVTTPVSVHNAVANSKNKIVTVVKPLPKNKQDPNIDKKIDTNLRSLI